MIFSSLGEICHSSFLLKRNNLKKESYPFDWILSSPSMIKHCIEDDFRTFMNKDYYLDYTKDSELNPYCSYHTFYGDMIYNYEDRKVGGKNTMFNHHNPLSNESDYEYFGRCIHRFKEMLKSNEPKLFISFYGIKGLSEQEMLDLFIDFNEFMGQHTNNHNLLVVHNQCSGYRSHKLIKEKNLYFLDLKTNTNTGGVSFTDEEDNIFLDDILKDVIADVNVKYY